jgi:hypothetical protein
MTAAPATRTNPAPRPLTRVALGAVTALAIAAGLVAAPAPASAAVCPAAFAPPFSDIAMDHPFCREILHGKVEGWSVGYADGTFRPLQAMTRQSAAAMLYELHDAYDGGGEVEPAPCTEAPFPDVPMHHPLCPYIREAADAEIFRGYDDGTFRPTQPISRQTAAAVLLRSLGPVAVIACEADPFPDVPWTSDFCEAIDTMAGAGVITGYEDGTFRPTETVSRQHFVAMVSRFTGLL